jgi:hypothetical protein
MPLGSGVSRRKRAALDEWVLREGSIGRANLTNSIDVISLGELKLAGTSRLELQRLHVR